MPGGNLVHPGTQELSCGTWTSGYAVENYVPRAPVCRREEGSAPARAEEPQAKRQKSGGGLWALLLCLQCCVLARSGWHAFLAAPPPVTISWAAHTFQPAALPAADIAHGPSCPPHPGFMGGICIRCGALKDEGDHGGEEAVALRWAQPNRPARPFPALAALRVLPVLLVRVLQCAATSVQPGGKAPAVPTAAPTLAAAQVHPPRAGDQRERGGAHACGHRQPRAGGAQAAAHAGPGPHAPQLLALWGGGPGG